MNLPPPSLADDPGAPYSQEAEEAVIGAVLVKPAIFVTVAAFLHADDFFLLRHNYIWQAYHRLYEREEPIDTLTVTEELSNTNHLDDIGGPAYLLKLVSKTPTAAFAEVYGRIVERTALRRRMLEAADVIRQLAMDEERNIDDVINEAESTVFNLGERQVQREFVPMWQALSDYYDRIERLRQMQQVAMGVPSGFRDLDSLLGGFQRSDLIVFAGRPGMGKTSFLLTAAMNAARLGARIAIFTMEMGVEQMIQRMVAMETGISVHNLRLGNISPREMSRFVAVVGRISEFQIFIDDTPAMSPMEMRTKCRRLVHEHGLDMVMVDYMQLMNAGGEYRNNRVQEITYISRTLKELARELNVPLISAAQLSRAVEQRQDKRPQLSDLRESGCLTGDTPVYLPDSGQYVSIESLCGQRDFQVLSLNTETGKLETDTVTRAFCTGTKPVYRLTTALGRTIRATGNHRFYTIEGWKRLDELQPGDRIAVPRVLPDVPEPVPTLTDSELALMGQQPVQQPVMSVQSAGERDIYWVKIVSIEADGEAEVFDLTVATNHNFVASNMIVHNSIEQDSDIVMFLYRDEVYNEDTEYPNQAEIIVAKHRNGPTGNISLYFEKQLTKFLDAAARQVDLGDLE